MTKSHPAPLRRWRTGAVIGSIAASTLAISGCTASTSTPDSSNGVTTITVATAAVPQFDDIRELTSNFEEANPDVKVEYVNLPEDQLRDQLTQGVATGSSPFDVVSIGPLEVPLWAQNGWLAPIDSYLADDPDFDDADIIPAVASGLTLNDQQYGVPISAEASMLMYRKDLFDAAGLTMPEKPTWADVAELAEQIQDPSQDLAGICLRGDASWGASVAALNPMINAFGGVWYDEDWAPQLSSAESVAAIDAYLNLQRNFGIPGASTAGFPECLTAFTQGNAAMWFDATSAGASVENPEISSVGGKVGYAPAPVESWDGNGWLWSWNLSITETSEKKDAAWKYLSYFGSKDYVKLVGEELGWERAPSATRASTYDVPEYMEAAPFAQTSLDMVDLADPTQHPVETPYDGILFLLLPSYQDFGTQVAKEVSAAITSGASGAEVAAAADAILTRFAEDNREWADGE
ncbi:sugar ABC transporter substrate-binding protein [Microbacterium sp. AK031]|uniref:ABC transporter substrate-binding protein n=1 Tax=Microbacterium sp. AK031 TaxID=2723076 RepID=UPI002168454C|nr:sugar ABC transporter substrate-binding protein [Microbacterium sp. AK031]MCS3845059.1 sorbitol/mannitol transport system substrate-binding protein [Microbacterium sp. AK031]